jgi:hypothetical protein
MVWRDSGFLRRVNQLTGRVFFNKINQLLTFEEAAPHIVSLTFWHNDLHGTT